MKQTVIDLSHIHLAVQNKIPFKKLDNQCDHTLQYIIYSRKTRPRDKKEEGYSFLSRIMTK